LGRYQEALNGYQAALQRNPCYVEAYCNIGVIYKNLGNLETAVHYYEKALTINPNFKIVRNNMAIALTDLGTKVKNDGDIAKSIDHYKKVYFFFLIFFSEYIAFNNNLFFGNFLGSSLQRFLS
jgi:protein O-GlcNAc transferase